MEGQIKTQRLYISTNWLYVATMYHTYMCDSIRKSDPPSASATLPQVAVRSSDYYLLDVHCICTN